MKNTIKCECGKKLESWTDDYFCDCGNSYYYCFGEGLIKNPKRHSWQSGKNELIVTSIA